MEVFRASVKTNNIFGKKKIFVLIKIRTVFQDVLLKVDTIRGWEKILDNQKVSVLTDNDKTVITTKNIILCPGLFP